MGQQNPVVRAVQRHDQQRWCELFAAYRAFYRLDADAAVVQRVWGWVDDPHLETTALVATIDDEVVGIANYRRFARPSTGSTGLWLDDLFTEPVARGAGVARALIAQLQRIAAAEELSVVRWITAEDNTTAQRLYDTLAVRTSWVTYDAAPGV